MKDLNRAFPETPESVRSAIREGCRRGARRRRWRHALYAAASAAAVVAILLGAFSLALNRARVDPISPQSGGLKVAAKGAQASPAPTERKAAPSPAATPEPTTGGNRAAAAADAASPSASAVLAATPEPTGRPSATPQATALLAGSFAADAAGYVEAPVIEEAVIALNADEAPESPAEAIERANKMRAYYSTEQGTFFHTDDACSNMTGAAARTLAEAAELGQRPCPVCMSADAEDGVVWATQGGVYYHAVSDCSDMRGATPLLASWARQMGKRVCPVCVTGNCMLSCWAGGVYSTSGGSFFHRDANCSGMTGAVERTLSQALARNQSPCPACVENSYVCLAGAYWNDGMLLLQVDARLENRMVITTGEISDTGRLDDAGEEDAPDALSKVLNDAEIEEYMAWQDVTDTMRIDIARVGVELAQFSNVAATVFQDEDGEHMYLLYEGVKDIRDLSLRVTVRTCFYYQQGEELYVSPVDVSELGLYDLAADKRYDQDGAALGRALADIVSEYPWDEEEISETAFRDEATGEEFQIAVTWLHRFDSEPGGPAILNVRIPRDISANRLKALSGGAGNYLGAISESGDGQALTFLVTTQTAEQILAEPQSLLLEDGPVDMSVVPASE